jgi:aspartyl-tRNA(Asn)/glutamyl-tRNA(Gln) amidotransferase subunit A
MNTWKPLEQLAADVNAGRITATELTKKALDRIEAAAEYQVIISTIKERSQERALQIDAAVARGEKAGRLAGIPFIAKDNFLVFGADTTAASNILKGFDAPYQSTAIEKLEAEGAICVAKANLDAFAHGASTENSDFFVTKNPHDKTKVPGGSSGGSAAAVVLGMVPFALGSDTGGSIRLPASYCGAVGFKPTYGLVSRSGVVAMGSSLDCIGPFTMSIEDAALVLDVMSGRDDLDGTTIERDTESYTKLTCDIKGKKIGIIKEYISDGVSDEVRQSVMSAKTRFESLGAVVEEISMPSLPLALAAYYIICPAEVSSNLSRYDGQRYGFSEKETSTLEESYKKSREIGFGKEAKRRIMLGTYVLSSGYYDAYYKKAQTVRTKLINEFKKAFDQYDYLIGPVAPDVAFTIGQNTNDPLSMYLVDIMTVAASLVGIPSISIPNGANGAGMPIGLQVMAPQKQDRSILSVAKLFLEEEEI